MKKITYCLVMSFMIAFASRAQTALTFNAAVPNYVQIGSAMNASLTGTNQITVEGWCYLTDYPFLPTLVGNYQSGTMQFLLRVDNTKATFWVDGGGGFIPISGASTIPLNTWTHLAGVWNGTNTRVYVNGVLDGTTAVTGAFLPSVNPVRIGANLLTEAFTGKLDDIRIWTVAHTATEINALKDACITGSEPNLLAAYSFEEGSGSVTLDKTAHAYNGVLVNNPVWAAGLGCVTLPVNFISIAANNTASGVQVAWKVGGEENILRYEVERSADGRNFSVVGTVPATHATSYSWLDRSLPSATAYYRVKSIEQTGITKYSGVAKYTTAAEGASILLAPNPVANRSLQLQFRNEEKGLYQLALIDATGRTRLRTSLQHEGGNAAHLLQLPASLASGIYQLQVQSAGKIISNAKLLIAGK